LSSSRASGALPRRGAVAVGVLSRFAPILFALAFVTSLGLEFWLQRGEPLWLDEAWTIGIAGPAPWIDFFHQVYWDVNAPLYYLLMYLWQGVFGQSDLAMRAPSLIFAVATPLVLAFSRVEGLGRTQRLTWASVAALWFPALCYAQEARSYAMLLFISTLQTLAFIRLLQTPTTGRAAIWSVFAALAILTHYDAIFLGAVQGLIYLAVHRLRAVRTWPAALAFVPAFGWLLYHLPRIAQFAQPGIAWYSALDLDDLTDDLVHLMGERQCWVLLAVGLLAVGLRLLPMPRRAPGPAGSPTPPTASVWLAALAAVLSAAVLIVIGFLRPSFAPRYLTPDGPGVLLGIVLLIGVVAGRRAAWALAVLVIALGAAVTREMALGERMAPRGYNYERASQLLEKVHPKHLVFLWDHPVDPIEHPEQLAAAGDAFFRRDGFKLSVDPVILKPDEDPNRRLLAGAAAPHSVILWVYDVAVHDTAAVDFPPRIATLDPAWTCRHGGGDRFGILACWRKSETP
jgi:hypothetical protein